MCDNPDVSSRIPPRLIRCAAVAAAVLLIACYGATASAQQCGGLWSALQRASLPSVVADVYELRCRIRAAGDEQDGAITPQVLRLRDSAHLRNSARLRDLRRLDALFDAALEVCDGHAERALLAAAVATIPYRSFPALLPLTGISVTVPISIESDEDLRRRLRGLPAVLLPDTPESGDRDKLAHFFGAAWLEMRVKSAPLTCDAGLLVEYGELLFKLEGAVDERDLTVNALGARFADRIMDGLDAAPSAVFLSVPPR